MVAVAIGAGAVVGAGASIISGNKAAKATKQAAQQASDVQSQNLDKILAQQKPWNEAGTAALQELQNRYLGTGKSTFTASPDYQWRLGQGQKALDNYLAAHGGTVSGNAAKAMIDYNQGQASTEFQNSSNALLQMAGLGQNSNNTTANAMQSTAAGQAAGIMAAGDASASSYMNTGSAINSGINNVLFTYMLSKGGLLK